MSVRRLRAYLIASVVITVAALAATLGTGGSPVLGLDLQGGISVVLAPVGDFRPASLDVAVDMIRNRVDALGVAEPEISRQGDNIVVDLPGVKDRDKARRLVGRTAELRFRPVLAELPGESETGSTTTTTVPGQTTTTTAPGATTTTTTAPASATDEATAAAVASCDPNQVVALLQSGTEIPNTTRGGRQARAVRRAPVAGRAKVSSSGSTSGRPH